MAVARYLTEVVLGSHGAMAIGLHGPFGSGKSSVVRLLQNELAVNDRWAVLHVSAERHTGLARARTIIYSLLEEARCQKLIGEKAYRSERACLEGTRQVALPRESQVSDKPGRSLGRYTRVALAALLLPLVVMIVLGVLLGAVVVIGRYFGLGQTAVQNIWSGSGGLFLLASLIISAPVISGFITTIKDAVSTSLKNLEVTVTTPRPDSTDELEQAFSRLLKLIDRRTVIAIDDIDRLTVTEVSDAVAVVRSLLLTGTGLKHPPVFVLSCDEDIVREAFIKADPHLAHRPADDADSQSLRQVREEAAREYINKLFTVRVPMPAHDDSDLRTYIERRLADPSPHPVIAMLGGTESLRTVLDVLIHPEVRDPRHAIRLVNAFLTRFKIAQLREHSETSETPRIADGDVTGHPIELARLVVLEHDFRSLHDRVVDEHDLLHLLDDALLGSAEALSDPLLQSFLQEEGETSRIDMAREAGLGYLRATAARSRLTRPTNIGPLLMLGSEQASRFLGSATAAAIRKELIQRDSAAFVERLAVPAERSRVLDAACATIKVARSGQDLDNGLAVACEGIGQIQDLDDLRDTSDVARSLHGLTDVLARRVDDAQLLPPAHLLAPLLRLSSDAYVPKLVRLLAERPDDRADAVLWASALIKVSEHHQLRAAVEDYFADLMKSGKPDDLEYWLNEAQSSHQNWPDQAYGALLAMACEHENEQAMDEAVRLTLEAEDAHCWRRPVILGAAACMIGYEPLFTRVISMLKSVDVPADGWGPSDIEDAVAGATLAGQIMIEAAEWLGDGGVESAAVTVQTLLTWLPSINGQPSPKGSGSASTTVSRAIAQAATKFADLAEHVVQFFTLADDADADEAFTVLVAAFPQHQRSNDPLGAALHKALVSYLRRPTPSNAQACVGILYNGIEQNTEAGAFLRHELPTLLSTVPGRQAGTDVAARLTQGLQSADQAVADQLLGSLRLVFNDRDCLDRCLPQTLAVLQGHLSRGHAAQALGFVAEFAEQPAVDVQWLNWMSQYWDQLGLAVRDLVVLHAIERQEALDNTGLPAQVTQHLIISDQQEIWSVAPVLWPRVDSQFKPSILARASHLCPELKDAAASASIEMLVQALQKADDLSGTLVFLTANPKLSSAIGDYLVADVASVSWNDENARTAVRYSPKPAELWQPLLDCAAEDQTSTKRIAVIIGHLIAEHPEATPPGVEAALAPLLRSADEESAEALGTAFRLRKPLARKIVKEASSEAHPESIRAFKHAGGIR